MIRNADAAIKTPEGENKKNIKTFLQTYKNILGVNILSIMFQTANQPFNAHNYLRIIKNGKKMNAEILSPFSCHFIRYRRVTSPFCDLW